MKKRFLALLLALVMVLTLLPTVTLFASAATVGTVNGTAYTSMSALISAISNKGNKTFDVHIYEDMTLSNDRITVGNDPTFGSDQPTNLTIHLHGHMIDRGLSSNQSYGNVFLLISGSTLTLIGSEDETEAATSHSLYGYNSSGSRTLLSTLNPSDSITGGVITGAYFNDADCGGICMRANCTLNLLNVAIVGNRNGAEKYGGGIRARGSGITINMDNSRICYNYSGQHGGGIRFDDDADNSTLILNNGSSIDHNYAGQNGGGIQSDAEIAIKGDGTGSISYNTCAGHDNYSVTDRTNSGGGGGIDIWKGAAAIENIIIEHNQTNSMQGGGISIEGEDGSAISGCIIRYNKATGSSYGEGGGVFLKFGNNSLSNCEIYGNTAYSRDNGDGVRLRTGTTNLGGKLIIKNNGVMGGTDGETLQTPGTNLYLPSGATINPSLSPGAELDMKVGDASTSRKLSGSAGTYNPIYFTYDNNATPATYGFKYYNSPSDDYYRNLYLVSAANGDHAPAEVRTVNSETSETITPDKVVADGTFTADGSTYAKIKTWFSYPSAANAQDDMDGVCFYSDGYFFDNLAVYNEHLATMSHALTMSGFYSNLGNDQTAFYTNSTKDADLTETRYDNRHAHVRQLLANIGCDDESIYMNDFNLSKPVMDSIGVAIAHKALKTSDGNDTGKILVPVVVRGSGYGDEWASNFTVGTATEANGEHLGFAMAANIVYSDLVDYINDYGLADAAANGNLIFWLVGYSRSGATANLTARRLLDGSSPDLNIDSVWGNTLAQAGLAGYVRSENGHTILSGKSLAIGQNQVVSYTFETPQGGSEAAEANSTKSVYYTLHNVVNAADLVPRVAMSDLGFKRYGVDHFVPGTAAGTITEGTQPTENYSTGAITLGNPTGVHTYRDNDPIYYDQDTTVSSDYQKQRAAMLNHYKVVNPYTLFDDYFTAAKINYVQGGISSILPIGSSFNEPVSDSTLKPEAYVEDLMNFIVRRFFVNDRDKLASTVLRLDGTDYTTVQDAGRLAAKTVFSLSQQESKDAVESLKGIVKGIGVFSGAITAGDIYGLWNEVLAHDSNSHGWPNQSEAKKKEVIEKFWGIIVGTGALDSFDATKRADLETSWPAIADVVFTIMYYDKLEGDTSDYKYVYGKETPNQRLGTALYNLGRLFTNHYSETVLAWLRTEDSFYTSVSGSTYDATETNYYKITRPSTVTMAAGTAIGEDAAGIAVTGTAEGATPAPAEVEGTRVVLHLRGQIDSKTADQTVGEAIYYRLDGDTADRIYTNGIELTGAVGTTKSVTAYAISYGVKSAPSVFTVKFSNQEDFIDDSDAAFTFNGSTTTTGEAGKWEIISDAGYSSGTAHKITLTAACPNDATVSAGDKRSVEFAFTGHGFRLFVETSSESGAAMIEVYQNGTRVGFALPHFYRGLAYDPDNTEAPWSPSGDYAATVYHQIPAYVWTAASDTDADYTVKITPIHTAGFDGNGDGESEFVFNGVSILKNGNYKYTDLRTAAVADDTATLQSLTLDGPYVFINMNPENLPDYGTSYSWNSSGANTHVYFFNANDGTGGNTEHAWATALIPTNTEYVYAVRRPSWTSDPDGQRWTHMIIVRHNPSYTVGGSGDPWSRSDPNYLWDQTANIPLSDHNYVSRIKSDGGQFNRSYDLGDLFLSDTVTIEPNSDWKSNGARFAVYFYRENPSASAWVNAAETESGSGIYEASVPSGDWDHYIVCRMNGSALENTWDNKWNQTSNIPRMITNVKITGWDYSQELSSVFTTALSGGLLVDGLGSEVTSVADFKTNGPKNLLYLDAGKALIGKVTNNATANYCDISAKGLRGLPSGLAVYAMDNTSHTLIRLTEATVDSYGETYFRFSGNFNLNGYTLVFFNSGTTPLALSRIRKTVEPGNDAAVALSFSDVPATMRAMSLLHELVAGTLVPIEPDDAETDTDWFVERSLTLSGEVGVNFIVNLNRRNPADVTAQIQMGGGRVKTVSFADLEPDANGRYKITGEIYAKEMTDKVTAVLYCGGEELARDSYAAEDYAAYVLGLGETGLGLSAEKLGALKDLCRKMLIYGAAAQVEFGYKTDALASRSLADTQIDALSSAEIAALPGLNLPTLQAYGIRITATSLVLRAATGFRLYFEVTDQAKYDELIVKWNGETLTAGESANGLYYELGNLPAKNVFDRFTLILGKTVDGSFVETGRGTVSAGVYARSVLATDQGTLNRAVTALYRYNEAAATYFN